MATLKWEFLEQAIKKLNVRAGSMQAKTFGLADDLAVIRDALAELQRNTMAVQDDNQKLHAALYKFLNPGAGR